MRIRVRAKAAPVVALILAVLIGGGTPFKDATNALRSTNASLVLAAADHFYWLNNGPAAAPLYARAEELFSQNGDKRNELHAKIGRLRCEAGFIVLAGVCNGT